MFAEYVSLVGAHPELVRAGAKRNSDGVANAPRVNLLSGAIGIKLEDARAIGFRGTIRIIRARTDGNVHFFAIGRKNDVARPVAAAAQPRRATGKMRAQIFRRSASFEIASAIWKPNHAVGISYVQELRLITGRIKGDSKWPVQVVFCKDFIGVRPAALLCIAQYPNLIGATFHDKDVAIWRSEEKARVAETISIKVNLETGRCSKLSVCRASGYTGQINCQDI